MWSSRFFASLAARRGGQSNSLTGIPLLFISPYVILFQAMAAVGLISFVIGASGVRPMRNRRRVCAPATADLLRRTLDGRSSLWVYGMFSPIPPVPLVPIFR